MAIIVLRRAADPATLKLVLGFFFIAALAAGLEPATAKAAALRRANHADTPVPLAALLAASALKALAASPFLALLWRGADPRVSLATLAWLPFVCVAGFTATDLRVLLDLDGRHAQAIWLKQGSLAGGLALLTVMTLAGAPVGVAIAASTGARLLVSAAAALALRQPAGMAPFWPSLGALLADPRWLELAGASAIAALGGSVDRLVGLRLLSAADWASYYLLYEMCTKFWFVPYVFAPILFARAARNEDGGGAVGGARRLTLALGAGFLVAAAAVLWLAPGPLQHAGGAAFTPTALAFVAAVVLSAFTQLTIADLQGHGAARRAGLIIAFGAVISAPIFYFAALRFGVSGLLWAWLIKSSAEYAATWVGGARGLAGQRL